MSRVKTPLQTLKLCLMTTASGIILMSSGLGAGAQDVSTPTEVDELDLIVISSARSKGDLSTTPGSVQIIEQEELRESLLASRNLNEFLGKYVPGLTPSNGTLAGSGQTLRGRSVQVLVNGAPRNIALRNNSRTLSLIDPNSIERIEIINGASAVYGDGATGGVINIITKTPTEEGLHGAVMTNISTTERSIVDGANTTTSADLSYAKDQLFLQLNGRFQTTGDMYDGDGNQIPEDPMIGQGGGSGIQQVNLSGTLGYEADAFDASLYGSWVYLDQYLDYFSDYSTVPVSVDKNAPYTGEPTHEDTKNVLATFNFYDVPVGDIKLEAYYNDSEKRASFVRADPVSNPFVYSDPGLVQSPDSQSVLYAKQAGIRSTVQTPLDVVLEGAQVTWGLDYSYNDVSQTLLDGRDIIAPMKQHAYAGFAQLDIPVTTFLDVKAGVRYERFDLDISTFVRPAANYLVTSTFVVPFSAATVYGADTSYSATVFNAGAVAHITDDVDAFANFSQGYSVPDIGAFTRRAVNTSNPFQTEFDYSDIAPDAAIVNNYEIGVRYNTARTSLNASAFVSTSDKGTNITADALTLSQNKERIWGAELTVDQLVTDQWNVGAILAYTEGVWDQDGDGKLDDDLPNSRIGAPFRATLYSGYDFNNGFKLYGEALFTSGRDADDGGTRQMKVKPTFTVNSRVGYDTDWGEFQLGVDNIFDRYQYNPTASSLRNAQIAAEGRRFFATFRKTF
ncbi:MAG: TonB-dependent receptor [Pseudomonadota bacterium]